MVPDTIYHLTIGEMVPDTVNYLTIGGSLFTQLVPTRYGYVYLHWSFGKEIERLLSKK